MIDDSSRWSTAGNPDLRVLVQYLADREHHCVSFTSRLIHHARPYLPAAREARIHVLRTDEPDTLKGAVLQTSSGFLFPVLESSGRDREAVAELSDRMTRYPCNVSTVMGMARDVDPVRNALPGVPVHTVRYDLMYLDDQPAADTSAPTLLRFRHAGVQDLKLLMPLQLKYETEEVLLPGRRINAEVTRYYLKQDLRSQVVVLAEHRGIPVAKAGTNARGFGWDQIGGVYTEKPYRNRGIGKALMIYLLSTLKNQGKHACLFVKQSNPAAMAMYRRLGFTSAGDFVITYYN